MTVARVDTGGFGMNCRTARFTTGGGVFMSKQWATPRMFTVFGILNGGSGLGCHGKNEDLAYERMNPKFKELSIVTLACVVAAILVFFLGPSVGKSLLHIATPVSAIKGWESEYERLDQIFPRVPANETRRFEVIRKLRQRGIRIDEGVDESIDHEDTPYAVFMRGWREWETLFGW